MNQVEFIINKTIRYVENYIYRGEGNAHLTLALPRTKKVLRLKKVELNCINFETDNNWLLEIRFYDNIMRPFLHPFVGEVIPVTLTTQEIQKLRTDIETFRPDSRKCKVIGGQNAALFEDYTYLPTALNHFSNQSTFSIEIKPKNAVLFPNNKCLFCEKQKIKLSTGVIRNITKYCPIDLFSGIEEKMFKAIEGLIDNPQNNFQLFKEGILAYGENTSKETLLKTVEDLFGIPANHRLLIWFNKLLQMLLLADYGHQSCVKCKDRNIGNSNLPKNCVLSKIYEMQSLNVMNGLDPHFGCAAGKFDYVHTYLDDVGNNGCPRCIMFEYLELNLSENNFNEIIPYYVAKVAKDCSIMISLKKIEVITEEIPKENLLQTHMGNFIFSIKILDLYPKPQK